MNSEVKHIQTKGNVEVQNIKVDDIHWEYAYQHYIKVRVLTLPEVVTQPDGTKYWSWQSKIIAAGKISADEVEVNELQTVNYGVREGLGHYGPNLYDNPVYHSLEYQFKWADEQINKDLQDTYGGVNSPD